MVPIHLSYFKIGRISVRDTNAPCKKYCMAWSSRVCMELIALHEALFVPCKNLLFNCIVQLLKPALLHGTLDDGQMVRARVFCMEHKMGTLLLQ